MSNPPVPTIQNVYYQDPYSTAPGDLPRWGVTVTCAPESGFALAARLMQGGAVISEACTQGAPVMSLIPQASLSDSLSYHVELQWIDVSGCTGTGGISGTVNWDSLQTARAPVVTNSGNTGELVVSRVTPPPSGQAYAYELKLAEPGNLYGKVSATNISKSPTIFSNTTALSFGVDSGKPEPTMASLLLRGVSAFQASASASPPFHFAAPYSLGSGVSHTVPLLSPAISSVSYDGQHVSLVWPAPDLSGYDGPVSYEILLSGSHGSSTIHPASSTGGSVALSIVDTSSSWTVSARVNFGTFKGMWSESVAVATGMIGSISQSTNAADGKATLSWTDPHTPASGETVSYNIRFSDNSPAPVSHHSGTTYALANPLGANALKQVAISRTVSRTSPAITATGPYSEQVTLGTNKPDGISASYDGSRVHISWSALPMAVERYIITLSGSASDTRTVPGNTSNLAFAPSTALSGSANKVTVQAQLADEVGPGLPAAEADIGFTANFFLSNDAGKAPYLYRAATLADIPTPGAQDISLHLPSINAASLANDVTEGPFTLSKTRGSGPYPFTLTIDKSIWTFSTDSIRGNVQTSYIKFLQDLEKANISAWGISVVQNTIARHMPQQFGEMLYYSYGLNLSAGHADLRTGMILRVVPSEYMVVPDYDRSPSGGPQAFLNGFLNGAPLDYRISSYHTSSEPWLLGFEAFLSTLVAGGALTVNRAQAQGNSTSGAAGAADLYFPAFLQPFFRLFIPQTLMSPNSGVSGATSPDHQFALAATDSYTKLTQSKHSDATNMYFRGRAVLELCIAITLNGQETIVPIGTTLRSLLERSAAVPASSDIKLSSIQLSRSLGTASALSVASGASWTTGNSLGVRFDYQALTDYGANGNALDLPLLHGDKLSIGA